MAVASSETANDAGATDGGVHDRDHIVEFCFET